MSRYYMRLKSEEAARKMICPMTRKGAEKGKCCLVYKCPLWERVSWRYTGPRLLLKPEGYCRLAK